MTVIPLAYGNQFEGFFAFHGVFHVVQRKMVSRIDCWIEDRIGLLEWDGEHGSMGDYPGAHAILKGEGVLQVTKNPSTEKLPQPRMANLSNDLSTKIVSHHFSPNKHTWAVSLMSTSIINLRSDLPCRRRRHSDIGGAIGQRSTSTRLEGLLKLAATVVPAWRKYNTYTCSKENGSSWSLEMIVGFQSPAAGFFVFALIPWRAQGSICIAHVCTSPVP